MILSESVQEPLSTHQSPATPVLDPGPTVPVPSLGAIPLVRVSSPLTPVVCDDRAITRLLEQILLRSGLTISEAARRLGVSPSALRQYINGRRSRPSLFWFAKFVEVCGSHLLIELPIRKVG